MDIWVYFKLFLSVIYLKLSLSLMNFAYHLYPSTTGMQVLWGPGTCTLIIYAFSFPAGTMRNSLSL